MNIVESYPRATLLENGAAAGLLREIDCSRLQHVVAAHLSERNNHPSLAIGALATVLDDAAGRVSVACQEAGFDWRQLA